MKPEALTPKTVLEMLTLLKGWFGDPKLCTLQSAKTGYPVAMLADIQNSLRIELLKQAQAKKNKLPEPTKLPNKSIFQFSCPKGDGYVLAVNERSARAAVVRRLEVSMPTVAIQELGPEEAAIVLSNKRRGHTISFEDIEADLLPDMTAPRKAYTRGGMPNVF